MVILLYYYLGHCPVVHDLHPGTCILLILQCHFLFASSRPFKRVEGGGAEYHCPVSQLHQGRPPSCWCMVLCVSVCRALALKVCVMWVGLLGLHRDFPICLLSTAPSPFRSLSDLLQGWSYPDPWDFAFVNATWKHSVALIDLSRKFKTFISASTKRMDLASVPSSEIIGRLCSYAAHISG